MANLVIDTNVLLDFLCIGRSEHTYAEQLLRSCLLSNDTEAHVLASSLKDAYYILCRYSHNEMRSRVLIRMVRGLFETHPLTLDIVDGALASDEPDFEDALVRTFAEINGFDAIISRDGDAFKTAEVPKFTPQEYLSKSWTRR